MMLKAMFWVASPIGSADTPYCSDKREYNVSAEPIQIYFVYLQPVSILI